LYDVAAGADINNVLAFCHSNNITVEKEQRPGQLYNWLDVHKPDYCFMYNYRSLVDVSRLGSLKKKVFNIHPGKLPQYRGPSPVFWQLKKGEETLGLTIHFITGKYDTGDIVWSREIKNEAHFSFGLVDHIFSNLLVEGVHYILNTGIDELVKKKVVQDAKKANTHKRPALKDVLINWQKTRANDVINLVKACNPWNKGAIAMYNNMEVKIADAEVVNIAASQPPGTITDVKDGLKVACAGNTMIRINFLTVNGIFVPARFVDKFGFATGQKFTSP
jgi:methionyl-tRNA formyltransferase